MNKAAIDYNWKLLYFDGFAGSGYIKRRNAVNNELIVGAARRILEIETPRSFDLYYFVEFDKNKADLLAESLKLTGKNFFIVNDDCNEKIESMSKFLSDKRKGTYKALAYIDPCGMQLKWSALETLKKHSVDAWILIPSGMGLNRLLKRNGMISKAWIEKLKTFLGMEEGEILDYFYKENTDHTLWGPEIKKTKKENAIEKSAILYKERLNTLFKYVSEPYILKNKANSIMFHFLMVSNNQNAANIATEIVRKYNT